jgi:hypothetical protein
VITLTGFSIIFYVFAITIPWLFFKDNIGNKISLSDYSDLTKKSQDLINSNHDYLLFISNLIPWISGFLVILGSVCIAIGLYKWWIKQKNLDEKEELELDLLRHNVGTLDNEESIEKAKKEVEDTALNSKSELKVEKPKVKVDTQSEQWKDLLSIEKSILAKIQKDNPINFEIKQNVKIADKYLADIVLQSYTKDKLDRLIEVKLIRDKIDTKALISGLRSMQGFAVTYINLFKKHMRGFYILIYDDELDNNNRIQELQQTLNRYIAENKLNFIKISLFKISSIDNLDLGFIYNK